MIVQESPLVSATDSSQLLEIITVLCVVLFVAVALAFVLLFYLRIKNQKRKIALDEQQAYWQRLLFLACDPKAELHFAPDRLKELKGSTAIFLWLIQRWSQMHQYVRGDADDGLQQFADKLKMQPRIIELMQSNNTRRLIACNIALGDMQYLHANAVIRLTELTDHDSSMVVLTALRALMRYDAQLALPLLLKNVHFIAPERLVTILRECPPKLLTEETSAMILQDNPQHAYYLLRVLKGLEVPVSADFIEALFQRFAEDEDVIAIGLSLANDPQNLPLIRRYTSHEQTAVRVQATAALARLAEPEDEARLWELVCDDAWWVRYRAAEGLFELPHTNPEAILAKAASLNDEYAQTMLKQVAVEVEYGVL